MNLTMFIGLFLIFMVIILLTWGYFKLFVWKVDRWVEKIDEEDK